MQEDYFHLRQNICSLKTSVDPADLRLRKLDIKNEREIKHPFYYISNNIKDIVIIGFEKEIENAKVIVRDSTLRENNLAFNYSLSFLFPIYFKTKLYDFMVENKTEIENNKIKIEYMDPEYLRRHISVTISGRWDAIVNIKNKLWKYLKNYVIEGIPKKHDINEFEQYAYNQEHKLISKSIRTYIIEQSPQIKNWDYISEDVEYLQQKYFNQKLIGQASPDKKKENQDVIENFIHTNDKETRVNYLINMRPGAYKKVFNMSQNDLFEDILGVLDETYTAYKNSKLTLDNVSNKSEEHYGFKEKNKSFKNAEDTFSEPQKISSSLFHPSQGDKKREESNQIQNNNYNENIYNSDNNSKIGTNSNYKKYSDNRNALSNNPLINLSNDNKINNLELSKPNVSTAKDSYSYYKNNNYSQYRNNSNNTLSNTNSFIPPTHSISNQKEYNSRQNYNYSRKDNDESSNSSFLNHKTNRHGSRSSSEVRKNSSYYNKKENRNYSDYDERKYYKYSNKYDKDYDRYDRRERRNSPYKEYYYDDSSYNNNSNNYSSKYDREREFEKERYRERDRREERDRERNPWQRSNSESPKNKSEINYNSNLGKQSSSFSNRYSGNNNDYINDSKIYGKDSYNYNSHLKDSYKDYRVYSQINRDRDNYSNRNYMSNDNKNMNYSDNNRYSSRTYYDNGYYKKRFFNDNKYTDKRKSNYISGNRYTNRQERSRSRSRSRNSRSRSRSWGKRSSHSRYRNRDINKRDHSNSNSVRKFNDNYQ